MALEPAIGPEQHPSDHQPLFLFLRQERREEDVIVDVFYCAVCLGRVEAVATGTPLAAEERPRPRGPLPTLGSARA